MLGAIFDKWWSQWNRKAILFIMDFIVVSALYKGEIIQENA